MALIDRVGLLHFRRCLRSGGYAVPAQACPRDNQGQEKSSLRPPPPEFASTKLHPQQMLRRQTVHFSYGAHFATVPVTVDRLMRSG
jgi:hypothetical protein